jgi:folate-binding protein YgfZ
MNKTNFYQGSMSVQLFESSVAGVVRVTGEDSLPYLQSQLTIDLNKLDPGCTRLGLRLTLKGKVLLGMQVIRKDEEEFWLVSRTQSPSRIIELLEQNVVADEVEFEPIMGEWKETVLYHPDSMEELFQAVKLNALSENKVHSLGTGWAFVDQLQPSCSLSIIHLASEPVDLEKPLPSPELFELEKRRLQAGLFKPEVDICVEEFPQEGGLEAIAVDFDKGCYLGQEVMARIHAMGKVRKQAVAAGGTGTVSNELPVHLMVADKKVGHLNSMVSGPDKNSWIGTAVIHENYLLSLNNGEIVIEGSECTIKPLKKDV